MSKVKKNKSTNVIDKGDFFRDIVEEIKDADTSIAADGLSSAEFSGFVDTGCYILNAALSASIYGGVCNNRVTAFAGETSTGKTFLALGVVKNFLQNNPTGGVLYYDTESAVTKDMMIERGIDANRVIVKEPITIQEFRTHAIKFLDAYLRRSEKSRPPMLVVLDSLGMLSSKKEIEDTEKGEDTRDMTKPALLKGTFRVLNHKLARAKIPMIVTNHVYDQVGAQTNPKYGIPKIMSGGCLSKETKIKTNKGNVEIQHIQIGDKVETLFGFQSVLETHKFDDKEVYEIEFTDGTKIKCSSDHKFLIDQDFGYKWVKAKNIKTGFVLMAKD